MQGFFKTYFGKFFTIIGVGSLMFLLLGNFVHAQVNGADYAVVIEASPRSEDPSDFQRIKLDIKSGKYQNSIFDATFKAPTKNIKRDLQKGDVVLVNFEISSVDQKITSVDVVDFYRVSTIFALPLIFIMLLFIILVVRFRRRIYIFIGILLSLIVIFAGVIFLQLNPSFLVIASLSITLPSILFIIYRKWYISIIGFAIPVVIGVVSLLLTTIMVQISHVEISFLTPLASFYNITLNDYSEIFYSAAVIASVLGGVYVAYQQILESVKIKISHEYISKKDLTIKSFRNMAKNFDILIFPSMSFFIGLLFSILLLIQRAQGVEAALNNDAWVSYSILIFITLTSWILTIPLCAFLCGAILGRIEQHKVITDKTISILD